MIGLAACEDYLYAVAEHGVPRQAQLQFCKAAIHLRK